MDREATGRPHSDTNYWGSSVAREVCDSEAKPTAVPYLQSKVLQSWQWKRPIGMRRQGKNNHPINVCRKLIPQVDTPLSPPVADRDPEYGATVPSCSYSDKTVTLESISNQFRGMAVSEASALVNYSDCIVCGKSVSQIQLEAVNDYISKTGILGETLAERETRRRAFLDEISAGTFLLMPGGVSQAAATDGTRFSISRSSTKNGLAVQKDREETDILIFYPTIILHCCCKIWN